CRSRNWRAGGVNPPLANLDHLAAAGQTWEREKGGESDGACDPICNPRSRRFGKVIRKRMGVAASAGAGPPLTGGPARIEANHLTAKSEPLADSASTAGWSYSRGPSTFLGAGAEEGVAGFCDCPTSGRGVSVPGMKVRR